MLQGEHSAILSTFINLPFVIKISVLSIFEWPFNTGLTVLATKTEVIQQPVKTQMKCENESGAALFEETKIHLTIWKF